MDQIDTLTDLTMTTNNTKSNSSNATSTATPTDLGISLPGYLQIDPRVDLRERQNGVLAKGAFGTVIIADVFKHCQARRYIGCHQENGKHVK